MSESLSEIRRLVGHRRLLLPGVAVLVWDDQDRLLLVHETDFGAWSVVGGAIDPGESPPQAALREVREETGLEVRLGPVREAVGGGEPWDVEYPNGDLVSYVVIVYDARVLGRLAEPQEGEVDATTWVRVDALAGLELTRLAQGLFRVLGFMGAEPDSPA